MGEDEEAASKGLEGNKGWEMREKEARVNMRKEGEKRLSNDRCLEIKETKEGVKSES